MADSGGTLIVRGGGGGRRVAGEGVQAAGKSATHPAEEMEEGMEVQQVHGEQNYSNKIRDQEQKDQGMIDHG